MNGLIVDKKAADSAIHEMRLQIAKGFNATDVGLQYMAFCRAQGIFRTLVTLDLLTESQKINYSADLTELEEKI